MSISRCLLVKDRVQYPTHPYLNALMEWMAPNQVSVSLFHEFVLNHFCVDRLFIVYFDQNLLPIITKALIMRFALNSAWVETPSQHQSIH
jgi:hypothetical protein